MPYVQFTPEALALNAAALALRTHAEKHLAPATMGWIDAYVAEGTRHGQRGIFVKPAARGLHPTLAAEFVAFTAAHAETAWTTGLLGSVAVATESQEEFPFAGPESWQERISREVAEAMPERVPTLAELRTRYQRLSPQPGLAEICRHVGIDQRHHVNVANAFSGLRNSIPAGQRQALGSWLVAR